MVSILVAGHYCHDTLISNAGEHRALGGSAAFASAVLDALKVSCTVVSKVGPDFLYQPPHAPQVTPLPTTHFIDDYRGGERRERVTAVAPPIEPADLPPGPFDAGIACAIAGEVPQRTLAALRARCRIVLADAQGLLRHITASGEVTLQPLHEDAAAQLHFLKASAHEAKLLDLAALRTRLTLLITDGPRGCTLLEGPQETHIPAYPAEERDPTGAGDCFLAGFAAGLVQGMKPRDAARQGAWFGARAVEKTWGHPPDYLYSKFKDN